MLTLKLRERERDEKKRRGGRKGERETNPQIQGWGIYTLEFHFQGVQV